MSLLNLLGLGLEDIFGDQMMRFNILALRPNKLSQNGVEWSGDKLSKNDWFIFHYLYVYGQKVEWSGGTEMMIQVKYTF